MKQTIAAIPGSRNQAVHSSLDKLLAKANYTQFAEAIYDDLAELT